MGVLACEAIGGEDVESVDGLGGDLITKSFEGGPQESAAAVPVVGECQVIGDGESILCDAVSESVKLAVDGAILGLLIGGNASVESDDWHGGIHGISRERGWDRRHSDSGLSQSE